MKQNFLLSIRFQLSDILNHNPTINYTIKILRTETDTVFIGLLDRIFPL